MEILDELSRRIDTVELRRVARILRESYNPLMADADVWRIIRAVIPSDVLVVSSDMETSVLGHHFVGQFLLRFYPGESTVKYHYIDQSVAFEEDVLLIEMTIDRCRLDLGKVNGSSHAFEIKTEIDGLARLENQLFSYSQAFEFVHGLVHPRHVAMLETEAPEHVGIETYELLGNECRFSVLREASTSPYLDPEVQIARMSSRDLAAVIRGTAMGVVPSSRGDREAVVRASLGIEEVNHWFKRSLKARFRSNTAFLGRVIDGIEPNDVGFFYHSEMDPGLVYYRPSSID